MKDETLLFLQNEPALAWKMAVNLQGRGTDSTEAQQAAKEVRNSPLVRTLLENRDNTGHAYRKWTGSHWILSLLADLGSQAGDESLRPLMEETFTCWLNAWHDKRHTSLMDGRYRRCASQEGYAAWSSLRLGFADSRTEQLISRLISWQWSDGGWNCDKHPEAHISSFMETLIPLRALILYSQVTGDATVKRAAERAAEVFLRRQMYKRLRDDAVMDEHFLLLHYPCYWHYDILFGLKVMAEAGWIGDPRCKAALDILESKRLPEGGFPAEESFSRPTRPQLSGFTPVTWGGRSTVKMNPFVSADAMYVLLAAGRSN